MESGNKMKADSFKELPSVDLLMRTPAGKRYAERFGIEWAAESARLVIDSLRTDLAGGRTATREALLEDAEAILAESFRAESKKGLRRVLNATGVIIHTNLGRAPLSDAVLEAIKDASGYCDLEFDLGTGKRGRRGERAEELASALTGAEEAVIVNNCAAAAVLVLTSLCAGGEAVISRGELVEIGGDFRVPDVMERSGARLVEVGTTNRTKIADYLNALTGDTKLILKVHPSNYRIVGFTSTPSVSELAGLAHENGLLLYEDAGSGALEDLSMFGMSEEPLIRRSIQAGADVVTFSGDKLLGSVQSGLIVGRANVIRRIRSHPLYRALRPGKLVYAALEASLESFLRGTQLDEIPVLKMLAADADLLKERSQRVVEELKRRLAGADGVTIGIVEGRSVVGGGAAPDSHPESSLIAVGREGLSANELEAKLRASEPPVIARIEDDRLLIDLRTVEEGDFGTLTEVLTQVLAK